ncbi:hypothetical protein Leryth_024368 [Lithospermum erythrorhizon]|nr:hypothetical protein Leryth_024368 [Lithospermum erythrorhizon]
MLKLVLAVFLGGGPFIYIVRVKICNQIMPHMNLFADIPKAIEIYEDIAKKSLSNNLLKYGVKGHLLNAGICRLCKGDVVTINNALEHYQDLDPPSFGTREYKLLQDAWKTTLLLRVKESVKAKELEEDDLT